MHGATIKMIHELNEKYSGLRITALYVKPKLNNMIQNRVLFDSCL